jgi:hypothetical protein
MKQPILTEFIERNFTHRRDERNGDRMKKLEVLRQAQDDRI